MCVCLCDCHMLLAFFWCCCLLSRVADPVWYWPDADPTSQDKPDPDPTSQDKPDPDPQPCSAKRCWLRARYRILVWWIDWGILVFHYMKLPLCLQPKNYYKSLWFFFRTFINIFYTIFDLQNISIIICYKMIPCLDLIKETTGSRGFIPLVCTGFPVRFQIKLVFQSPFIVGLFPITLRSVPTRQHCSAAIGRKKEARQ